MCNSITIDHETCIYTPFTSIKIYNWIYDKLRIKIDKYIDY